MSCSAVHQQAPVQWWRNLCAHLLLKTHLPRRAVEPSAADPLTPMTAVGARPKEEKDETTAPCRTGSASRFFSSRSEVVETGKERALACAANAGSVADNPRCQLTQLLDWMIPWHLVRHVTPLPRGTWQPRWGSAEAAAGTAAASPPPTQSLPASAWLAVKRRGYGPGSGTCLINRASSLFHQYWIHWLTFVHRYLLLAWK